MYGGRSIKLPRNNYWVLGKLFDYIEVPCCLILFYVITFLMLPSACFIDHPNPTADYCLVRGEDCDGTLSRQHYPHGLLLRSP